MSETVYKGACFCGDCTFEYAYSEDAKPVFAALCHCRLCRNCTASSAAHLVGVPKGAYKLTKGEPKTFTHPDYPSFEHSFCPNCGGHVTQGPKEAGFVAIFPTNLEMGKEKFPEVPSIFKPQCHMNFENAMIQDAFSEAQLPKFKDFPKEMGGSGDML